MGCDYAIAETLRDLPTTGAVKKVSHRGMVEVPSHVLMFGGGLVFVNEKEVALGKQREELLRGATVYADLGNWCYAEVLDRFLYSMSHHLCCTGRYLLSDTLRVPEKTYAFP